MVSACAVLDFSASYRPAYCSLDAERLAVVGGWITLVAEKPACGLAIIGE